MPLLAIPVSWSTARCIASVGVVAAGFEKPSATQQMGIVPFAQGHDVIQQAQSGTGKTATFCTGILQLIGYDNQQC